MRKSTKVWYAWDSGSVTALVSDLLTQTQAGNQCPGFTWKKYHPHKLNKREDFEDFFVEVLELS